MAAEPEFRLIYDLDPEGVRWRRRTLFLLSIIFHALLVTLLINAPNVFRESRRVLGIPPKEVRKPETAVLLFPTDLLKRHKEPPPKTNILSDKNRHARGRSPVIDRKGLHMPYSRGNTRMPEIAGGNKRPLPPPPPAAPASPPPTPPRQTASAAPPPPPPPKKADNSLHLMNISPPKRVAAGPKIPLPTAGEMIQQSAQEAARGNYGGASLGPGDSPDQFQNIQPNFSTSGPIILSDTRGVNFGPYLARVVYAVRRNWYAVIPESARLGEKGRVAVVFEILKDGSVPQIRLVGSSASEPLDRAAIAGIRASIPFPPLPQAFTGKHLVLEFIFFYNEGDGP